MTTLDNKEQNSIFKNYSIIDVDYKFKKDIEFDVLNKFLDDELDRAKKLSGVDDKTVREIPYPDGVVHEYLYAARAITCTKNHSWDKYNDILWHVWYIYNDQSPEIAKKFGIESKKRLKQIIDSVNKEWIFQVITVGKVEKGNKKMSVVDELTEAADEAQWRIYQRQAMKRVKDALLMLIKKQSSDRNEINIAKKFLDSKIGEGILCAAIGFGGSRIPMFGDNPKFSRLMKEFRVEGMAVVGDDLVEKVVGMLMPTFSSAISEGIDNLPEVKIESKKKKARIKVTDEEAEHEEIAVKEATEKKALRSVK